MVRLLATVRSVRQKKFAVGAVVVFVAAVPMMIVPPVMLEGELVLRIAPAPTVSVPVAALTVPPMSRSPPSR